MAPKSPIRLGAPFWSFKPWRGTLFSDDARTGDYLAEYASVFDTVEGNTTFYRVPTDETVTRWGEAVPDGFRFCFKLPREITHDHHLHGVARDTDGFLRAMAPLGERLGPFMIQLPPSFGPGALSALDDFLTHLPREFHYAVELRHPDFFTPDSELCARADALLASHECDRVIMDTRPLRAGDAEHPDILEARHKKPDLPLHPVHTATRPLVRVVLHPEKENNEVFLEEWADRITAWSDEEAQPYFFLHTPSNVDTPNRLRDFHARLRARRPGPALAEFLGGQTPPPAEQLSLFGT